MGTQNTVIQMPAPRERTPQVIASLRGATIKDVRKRLADHSRISAKTWIHIGKCLVDVRDDLTDQPKAFAAMFSKTSDERNDERRFPFSYSTAKQLICIAQSEVNSVNSDHLPLEWGTLYQLAKLPRAKLDALIESGAIHPMMTRAEASKLAGTKTRKKPPAERTYDKAYSQHLELLRRLDEGKRLLEILNLLRDCGVTLEALEKING